ncbi:exodeoxyribonuclease V, gamma subunit [Pseudoxanthomonas suwonensis 11-1]|uniref:RecBCD enzyme subunit RecC n=1 Tax=Pseudoxanthomonas suwonensis (strain 11-1) TaxID=743721 RepID=E6WXK8_PSEUU|nr:exodeoxyribonuclease V subunit gamma [Pseudoxanthomonas suwonensis]ADV28874.1 exodeoxyribonuclease V, gamma subunit [Pseudoxanthomonas suwonensis 11-1]
MPEPRTDASPDFRLYHSNSLEILAGILAQVLRQPAPGQSLLAPEVVLIPQVAMRRWLQATLAAEHGVAANIEFLTPGEFVGRALAANLPAPRDEQGRKLDELDVETLHWHLYAALTDRALLAQPAMQRIAAHVGGDDPLRAWSLAGELANVFNKYQAWRRDWLLRWEDGAGPDDPQAILWRRVARGRPHRARRIQQYLERFDRIDGELPRGLPTRLSAFATLNVSPDVLRVIATQARVGSLHLFVPSPVADYWGDLQRLRRGETAQEAGENLLLQRWGAAGADFMHLVGSYELVHASAEFNVHADPAEGGGALQGSLLRRLQADVYHRRASPGAPLRATVALDDPSLQLHACHTRLRELQVLADQLRALFDDPRFDPPLQPREVAVLAPDIDPYLPYLEPVFGRRGDPDAIPYALADTSPLANEPLAGVFLRLLALPVSRFGLHEVLDLLASPAVAEANELDAPALERLRSWLSAAGARWGIDAAHRARLDAPEDDAYTWSFALDRLLLGHASGSDEPVLLDDGQVVAPMPELEGSAIDALDTLVRLLRVLALHERVLGGALAPAQWRERLLQLLVSLLPKPPSDPKTQRALDRLRSLVDAFAQTAKDAGYEAPVPSEAVRAHFAAMLSEADTRAPLLTGGVSIGRMVPMRLLPFRAICVLGMNDGEFPRRDPAAGLNRLTAELGTPDRRHGDRSTREDDRFLFLQLMAAAQDVFYVSWIGRDPRDGSEREPSVLVSELLEAAAAQHEHPPGDTSPVTRALVVEHPLQPFSPDAFGSDGEPRRFSYRRDWREAAAQPSAQRSPLAPWFNGQALPAPPPADEPVGAIPVLPLEALRRFLLNPAREFLNRVRVRLPEVESHGEDLEPLAAPAEPLERTLLQRAVFESLLRGDDAPTTHALLRARGLLPSGASGRSVLERQARSLLPWREAFASWRGTDEPQSRVFEATIDGTGLRGQVDNIYPQGIARVRFGQPNGPAWIRQGLDWLLAAAAGEPLPLVLFHEGEPGTGHGPFVVAPPTQDQAKAALAALLQLREQGLAAPLPFMPYSGWEIHQGMDDYERSVPKARGRWHGNGQFFAEGEDASVRLALRGCDPFAEPAMLRRFVEASHSIYAAVTGAALSSPVDPLMLKGLASRHDAEDAA